MADSAETPAEAKRRRLINFGEVIALAALIVSALGLWNGWSHKNDKPAVAIEKARLIPLALRGKVDDDGKRLLITPIESTHSLESLLLRIPGKPPIDLGSDAILAASAVEALLPKKVRKDGTGSLAVTLDARYIEAGNERHGVDRYRLSYRWSDGGLFRGHSLRLIGLSRD